MSKVDAQPGARTRARELLVQALYQMQIGGHSKSALLSQFADDNNYARVDQAYFDTALAAICDGETQLLATIADIVDRAVEQLDPVERAILLIGIHEMAHCADIPYRVVINEGVNLARRFGAEDGHKYINACLDAAARRLRRAEAGDRN